MDDRGGEYSRKKRYTRDRAPLTTFSFQFAEQVRNKTAPSAHRTPIMTASSHAGKLSRPGCTECPLSCRKGFETWTSNRATGALPARDFVPGRDARVQRRSMACRWPKSNPIHPRQYQSRRTWRDFSFLLSSICPFMLNAASTAAHWRGLFLPIYV